MDLQSGGHTFAVLLWFVTYIGLSQCLTAASRLKKARDDGVTRLHAPGTVPEQPISKPLGNPCPHLVEPTENPGRFTKVWL
jgi:hypothetical protein